MKIDPYLLDWGEIFVESYNTQDCIATIIYNFNFNSASLLDDIFTYSIGHIFWVYKNLPIGSSITVVYDIRNIIVEDSSINKFKEKIQTHLRKLDKSLQTNIVFNK